MTTRSGGVRIQGAFAVFAAFLALAGTTPVAAASHAGSPPGRTDSAQGSGQGGNANGNNAHTATSPASSNQTAASQTTTSHAVVVQSAAAAQSASNAGNGSPHVAADTTADTHNGNAGDVWLDVAGAPSGPGHEHDPQLGCVSFIQLWGAGLADSGGSYSIVSIPPTGGSSTFTSSWSYSSGSQPQRLDAVVPVASLLNGVSPANHGFHFKLNFEQDPQKHKTFWVSCRNTETTPTTGTPPGGPTTPSGSVLGISTSSSPSGAVAPVTASTAPAAAVAGTSVAVPGTGVRLPVLPALILILAGGLLTAAARRMRRSA